MVVLLWEADQVMVAIFCRPASRFDHNGGTQPPREGVEARSPIMSRIWHSGGSFHHSCLDNEADDGKFPIAGATQHEGGSPGQATLSGVTAHQCCAAWRQGRCREEDDGEAWIACSRSLSGSKTSASRRN